MSKGGMRMTEAEARLYEARMHGRALAVQGVKRAASESPAVAVLWATLETFGGWVREFEFHPLRHWRFDFAQPELRIAVELEGQVHRIEERFAGDLLKYNEAILEGWLLLRFSPRQVQLDEAASTIVQAIRLRRPSGFGGVL